MIEIKLHFRNPVLSPLKSCVARIVAKEWSYGRREQNRNSFHFSDVKCMNVRTEDHFNLVAMSFNNLLENLCVVLHPESLVLPRVVLARRDMQSNDEPVILRGLR